MMARWPIMLIAVIQVLVVEMKSGANADSRCRVPVDCCKCQANHGSSRCRASSGAVDMI